MKFYKNDVQCISFFRKPHPIHEAWMNSISSRKIIPYVPDWLLFKSGVGIKKIPFLAQIASFFYGLFIPSAKIYLIEAPATASSVLLKKGIVISINSDTFFYDLRNFSLLKKIYAKMLVKRIDGFISTSEYMKKQATKPSEAVYPFMDSGSLFNSKPDFDNDNICNISGIRFTKGTDILIDVFKKYKKKHKDAMLFAPGWSGGDSKTNWIEKIKKAGGVAPGFVPAEPYYKKCSIFVNPARHEPFGVNILESMAAGIPPLVSEYCGAAEIAKKIDRNLVIPLDAEKIVKRIEWLKSDKKRYYKLSRRCKNEAKKYTKERSIKEFKEKFIRLVERLK